MNETGSSDCWDIIIEKYCSKEEKNKVMELEDYQFERLEDLFYGMLSDMKDELKNLGVVKSED